MSNYYSQPDLQDNLSTNQLKQMDTEGQLEIMRAWFYGKYQDPVHECPYEGSEGGYAYIYGGPYDASEELFAEFGDVVDDEVITGLSEELECESSEWSGISGPEHYDDYYYDLVGSIDDPKSNLYSTIETLRGILTLELDVAHEQALLQMIYVNLITALEAYLSEFFIGQMENNSKSLRAFVESNPDFKKEKFSFSEIYRKSENINSRVKEYLIDLMWHNLPKIKSMFKSSLNIDFPESLGALISATHKRHDLVHRGGKTKSGEQVIIHKNDVHYLIDEVVSFVEHIENSQ